MLDTLTFGQSLCSKGYRFYTGVPCSYLKDLINYASNHHEYLPAANEGDAVALAAGAELGGRKTVVLLQNSGFGNAVSPLSSLTKVFDIPIFLMMGWRGAPEFKDEPQHLLMGEITPALLDLLGIAWAILSDVAKEAEKQLELAVQAHSEGQSFCLLIRKEIFSPVELNRVQKLNPPQIKLTDTHDDSASLDRFNVMRSIVQGIGQNTAYLATTGYTSRELHRLGDRDNYFYMVGSMGCLGSLALGVAISQPELSVVAFDGDGALLMRMGALSTIGYRQPPCLLHVVFDNGCYESTGSQPTLARACSIPHLALASGYSRVCSLSTEESVLREVQAWLMKPQLTLIHILIKTGTLADLGRPRRSPNEVGRDFSKFIRSWKP